MLSDGEETRVVAFRVTVATLEKIKAIKEMLSDGRHMTDSEFWDAIEMVVLDGARSDDVVWFQNIADGRGPGVCEDEPCNDNALRVSGLRDMHRGDLLAAVLSYFEIYDKGDAGRVFKYCTDKEFLSTTKMSVAACLNRLAKKGVEVRKVKNGIFESTNLAPKIPVEHRHTTSEVVEGDEQDTDEVCPQCNRRGVVLREQRHGVNVYQVKRCRICHHQWVVR